MNDITLKKVWRPALGEKVRRQSLHFPPIGSVVRQEHGDAVHVIRINPNKRQTIQNEIDLEKHLFH